MEAGEAMATETRTLSSLEMPRLPLFTTSVTIRSCSSERSRYGGMVRSSLAPCLRQQMLTYRVPMPSQDVPRSQMLG